MQSIYIWYLYQVNTENRKHVEIYICALGLEKKFYIINKEKKPSVSLFQKQTIKVKRYEKKIDIL